MLTILRDFRYALRKLRNSPSFVLTATLTLALGVGASTAIFSVVYGLLLESLPFRDASRIVSILETHPQIPEGAEATFPDYQDWSRQQKSFEQIAAYSTLNPSTVSLVWQGQAQQVHRVLASGSFFSLLGVSPLIGRTIGAEDDKPGANHVAVISAEAWQRYFGRDPGVVGKSVALDGVSYTVIGVLPFGAAYPGEGEVWLPMSLLDQPTQESRVWHSVRVLGRLRDGVEISQARADMRTIAARIAASFPATNKKVDVRVTPLRDQLVGAVRPAVLAVAGSVALVLLIACTNVGSLFKVRAIANRREAGIRQALGASRSRLIAQPLAQAIILCLLGGTFGAGLAFLVLPLLRLGLSHTAGIEPSMVQSIQLNVPVLLFTLSICCVAAVAFGLLPALNSSPNPVDALHQGDRGGTSIYRHGRGFLISTEVGIAVVVVLLSVLAIRSFQRLIAVDPGIRTDHLLSVEINLPEPQYKDDSPVTDQFYEHLLSRIAAAPGVVSTTTTTQVPMTPSLVMTRFLIEGAPPLAPGTFPIAQMRFVAPGFFSTLGLGLRQGRIFNQGELDRRANVVVVNQAFADRYLKDMTLSNAQVILGVMSTTPTKIPVIGIVANSHDLGVDTQPQPEIYLPGFGLHDVLLVRTASDPRMIVQMVRNAVRESNPNLAIYHVETLDEILTDSTALQKATAAMLGLFAFLSLALAIIGIYGVMTYSIAQRTREIGVRMAVGANRGDILRRVFTQALKSVSIGLLAGLAAALMCARLVGGLLFDTRPADPLSICVTVLALVAASVFAIASPAHRAMSVSPTEALRAE